MQTKAFSTLEQDSKILKSIAEQYPHDSKEYIAVEHAAFALAFAITEEYERFCLFIKASGDELTDEQKAHLKSLGLQP